MFDLSHVRDMPEWVVRWERARAADDERLFPEQDDGVRSLHMWNGSPVGDDAKFVGYPSGYEDVVVKLATPHDDRGVWVQPDEYLHDPHVT